MGFSRQEYWSGLPFPSPGDLPNPGIEPASPTLQADSLPSESPGKPHIHVGLVQLKTRYGYYTGWGFHPSFHLYGEGNGTPRQDSCLENPMDGGAWWAAVHGVARSQIRLSDFTFPFHFHALEKELTTHSTILAWRVPGTGEPGGLPSMGSHRVEHDWGDLAAAAAAAPSLSWKIKEYAKRALVLEKEVFTKYAFLVSLEKLKKEKETSSPTYGRVHFSVLSRITLEYEHTWMMNL